MVPGSFDVNVYCGVLLSEEFGTGVISLITGRIISGNTVNEISNLEEVKDIKKYIKH